MTLITRTALSTRAIINGFGSGDCTKIHHSKPTIWERIFGVGFSWHLSLDKYRANKKQAFSELMQTFLVEFNKNNNSISVSIDTGKKVLTVSEYNGSVELGLDGVTKTLEKMTLKHFVTRLKLDIENHPKLYPTVDPHLSKLDPNELAGMHLTDMNLAKMDLSGFDLRGTTFENTNLEGVTLRGAKVDGNVLLSFINEGVDLTLIREAIFDESALKVAIDNGIELSEANLQLTGFNSVDIDMTKAIFDKSALQAAIEKGVVLSAVNLRHTDNRVNLEDAIFDTSALQAAIKNGIMLSEANLQLTGFNSVNLKEAIFDTSALQAAIAERVVLSDVNLRHTDNSVNLKEAIFDTSALQAAIAEGVALSDINLSQINLRKVSTIDHPWYPDASVSLKGAILLDESALQAVIEKEGDLTGVHLTGISLSNINLSQLYASMIKMGKPNLRWAILDRESLLKAIEIGFDLSGTDLTGLDLRGIKFPDLSRHDVQMKGAQLGKGTILDRDSLIAVIKGGADLRGVNPKGVKLNDKNILDALKNTEFNLNDFNLNGVTLNPELLVEAIQLGANLEGAIMEIDWGYTHNGQDSQKKNSLRGANLKGLIMDERAMNWAILEGANMRDVNFTGYNFRAMNWEGINLENVNLKGAILSAYSLNTMDNLQHVNLEEINLFSAGSLAGVNLTNTNISLALPTEWNDNYLESALSHPSLLSVIDSIKDEAIKIKLMRQLLKSINKPQIQLSPYRNNLLSLLKQPYLNDPEIVAFLTPRVIQPTIEYANSNLWTGIEPHINQVFLNVVKSDKNFNYIKNNGFFIQLILNSLSHYNPELSESAQQLYEKYLSLERIKPIAREFPFDGIKVDDIEEKKPDLTDPEANHWVLVVDDCLMMLSQKDLTAMLTASATGTPVNWNNFFLYRQDQGNYSLRDIASASETQDVGKVFKAFKPLYNSYQFAQKKEKLINLLGLLNLNQRYDEFVAAINAKNLSEKQKQEIASEYYNEFILAINTRIPSENKKKVFDSEYYKGFISAINAEDMSKEEKQATAFEYYNEFILAINTKSTSEENKRIVDFKSYDKFSAEINAAGISANAAESAEKQKMVVFKYYNELSAAINKTILSENYIRIVDFKSYDEFSEAIDAEGISEEEQKMLVFKYYDELSAAINTKILSEKSKKIFDFQYHDEFIAALNTKYIPEDTLKKIVSPKKKQVLGKIFAKILSSDTGKSNDNTIKSENLFDDKHYKAIIDTLGLVNADKTTQAQNVFSVAAIITKFSSEDIFGTHGNSPEGLRQYALWLMLQAYKADPEVFKVNGINKMDEWKNKLLGLNGQFSCTGVLSGIMIQHAKAHFPDVIGDILPPAWS